MAWYVLVNDATGALLGAQSLPILNPGPGQVVVEFAGDRPDQGSTFVDPRNGEVRYAGATWNTGTRTYVPNPAPTFIDRALQLRIRIRNELATNADFVTARNALNAANRNRLDSSLDTVITDNIVRALRMADRWASGSEPLNMDG